MVKSSQQVAIQGPYSSPCTTAGCTWQRTKGTARIALANPNSGPGSSRDAAWGTLITDVRTAGALMLGYVYTQSGTRDATVVQAEVARCVAGGAGGVVEACFCCQVNGTMLALQSCQLCGDYKSVGTTHPKNNLHF